MTGTEARKKIKKLTDSGWTEPEIAAQLGLRSTDTFRKWQVSNPLPHTAKALARMRPRGAK